MKKLVVTVAFGLLSAFLLGVCAGTVVLVLASCSHLPNTWYNAADLPPEYSQAFTEVLKIMPTADKIDYWQTPKETLARGQGDCEDFAFLLEYECTLRGLPAPVVFGKAYTSNMTFHAWNEVVTSEGDRVVMDAWMGTWMVNPGVDYYVTIDLSRTDRGGALLVQQMDYAYRLRLETSETPYLLKTQEEYWK